MFKALSPEESIQFLNGVQRVLKLKNDSALALTFECKSSHISGIRHGRDKVTSNMILRVIEDHDWSFQFTKSLWSAPMTAGRLP